MLLVEVIAETDAGIAEEGKDGRVHNVDVLVVGAATSLNLGVIIETADIQHQTHILVGADFEIDDVKSYDNAA